jgi:hypothetical protein
MRSEWFAAGNFAAGTAVAPSAIQRQIGPAINAANSQKRPGKPMPLRAIKLPLPHTPRKWKNH